MSDYRAEYKNWTESNVFDADTKRELLSIKDEKEIEDRFYKSLSFGTGGMRGVIGAGINRINIYTVGKATQGLANYINENAENKSAVIAFDSRRMSPEFAMRTALVLAANGIKAYLFESLRPTPELSFSVRYLGAAAGVCITASHNPPEYNGYKVYWSDGGQIVPPHDTGIIAKVNAIANYGEVKSISESEAKEKGLLEIIGKEVDDAFISSVKNLSLADEEVLKNADKIKIVYTPLHGAGNVPVRRVLKETGFNNVYVVAEQEEPDGNFTTLKYPNPEDPAAFTYALKLAEKVKADVVLATDPDSDRLGVYVFDDASKEYKPFTGNMSGLLIAEYLLSQKEKLGLLPKERKNGALITTIVSSDMAKAVGKYYGLTVIEVLTGFKYIGEQIKLFEEAAKKNGGDFDYKKGACEYLFGFEESYGCLLGTYARDKDAVAAVMMLAEAAAFYKGKGKTLCDVMRDIYEKYGYYKETIFTAEEKGATGAEKIKATIDALRKSPAKEVGGFKTLAFRDYEARTRVDLISGKTEKVALPQSNVLYYELDGAWCCVRPSGTEPKIKFYFGVKADSDSSATEKLENLKKGFLALTK